MPLWKDYRLRVTVRAGWGGANVILTPLQVPNNLALPLFGLHDLHSLKLMDTVMAEGQKMKASNAAW